MQHSHWDNRNFSSRNDLRIRIRKTFKKILIVCLTILVLAVIGLLVLPSVLSSGLGRKRLLAGINDTIRGQISVGRMHLSWFGGQQFRQVALKDPSGATVASFDTLSTGASLLRLAFGGRDLGRTVLDGLRADIQTGESGRTNLQEALAPRRTHESSLFLLFQR